VEGVDAAAKGQRGLADLGLGAAGVVTVEAPAQERLSAVEGGVLDGEHAAAQLLVAAEVEWRHHRVEEDVKNAGLELDAYLESQGQSHDDFHAELRTGAEQAVKSQLILDAIADKEEIGVSDADLSDQVVRQAQRSGVSPEVLAQQIMQAGQLGALVGDVRRGKALALVTQNAQITDASGRPVSLDALREQLGGGQPDEGDDDDEPGDEPADDTAR